MTKRTGAKAEKLLKNNPGLSYRDMRDLLMEYGVDGITAGELSEGRHASPGMK